MISRDLLEQAARKNIIQSHQIEPLVAFIREQETIPVNDSREEPLRFVHSFGDLFIALGVVLLLVAINMLPLSGYAYLIPAAGFILISEWLVRVRRLALPGIALLISILFFVNKAFAFDNQSATSFAIGILSLTSLIFYLRYKMPFSLLPLTAGLVAIAIIQAGPDMVTKPILFTGFGLLVFILAMWFDVQDTARVSHLSDCAFWLHLLASPLIVHGIMMSMLLSDPGWLQAMQKEFMIVILFSLFLLLALLLDRRALLISTQLYMIYALTQLFQDQFSNSQNVLTYVLVAFALFVIFFGSFWYKTRCLVFGFLRHRRISGYLPVFDLSGNKHRQ